MSVIRPPALSLERLNLGLDLDVRTELSPSKTCSSQVEDPMAGGRAYRPPFSAATGAFQWAQFGGAMTGGAYSWRKPFTAAQ